MVAKSAVIALFDVDGTLTAPRKELTAEMQNFMKELRKLLVTMIMFLRRMDLLLIKKAQRLASCLQEMHSRKSLKNHLGEEKLKEFINFTLKYIADLDIPIKRGTFVEFRNGMLNVSPIGRNCSQEERDEFEKYDKVFPRGWDKTYCLRYLDAFNEIHFFGDKTFEGGNDHEIFASEKTLGHTVTSPEDTMKQCAEIFLTKTD